MAKGYRSHLVYTFSKHKVVYEHKKEYAGGQISYVRKEDAQKELDELIVKYTLQDARVLEQKVEEVELPDKEIFEGKVRCADAGDDFNVHLHEDDTIPRPYDPVQEIFRKYDARKIRVTIEVLD